MPNEIVNRDAGAIIPHREAPAETIVAIIKQAVESKIDAASIERLCAVYERMEDRAAQREFAGAMSRFQKSCPPIPRDATANIVTKGGAKYSYRFAPLDTIERTIKAHLHREGISYGWDMVFENGNVICTCHVRHENGHSIKASFACPADSKADISGPQRVSGANTTAQRKSLVMALGPSISDVGDLDSEHVDAAETGTGGEFITPAQAAQVRKGLAETHGDEAKFCKWLAVDCIEGIKAGQFARAIEAIDAKRKKMEEDARIAAALKKDQK